jgi:hypothetical protein
MAPASAGDEKLVSPPEQPDSGGRLFPPQQFLPADSYKFQEMGYHRNAIMFSFNFMTI